MKPQFEEAWRRRFIERGNLFDDDASIAGWTRTGLEARLDNFRSVWPGDHAGAVWLDAGCGAGSYTRLLARSGVEPVGLDYSLPSVRKARARGDEGIAWVTGDVTRLPVRPGSLDGVLCFGVLQALDRPERAIAELTGAVRPGGQVWIDALNGRCLPTLARRAFAQLTGRSLPLRYHTARELADLMRRQGVRDVRLFWVPIMPAALARLQPLIERPRVRALLRRLGPLASPFSHAVLIAARKGAAETVPPLPFQSPPLADRLRGGPVRRIRESLRSAVKALGPVDGLAYLVAQGLERISCGRLRFVKYDLVVQPLPPEGIAVPAHRGADLIVREVRQGDELLGCMGHSLETMNSRFAQGARCLAATDPQGALAGFLWWIEGAYLEDEVRCRFVPSPPDAAVWDFDVFVAATHRGGATFVRLWDALTRELSARGFRYTCSRISAFNAGSLSAHRRLGARTVARQVFLNAGRLQVMLANRRPWVHVSFSDASMPVVEVAPPRS